MKNKKLLLFVLVVLTLLGLGNINVMAEGLKESSEDHNHIGGELYYNNIKALNKTAYSSDINASYYDLSDGQILGYNKKSKKNQMVEVENILNNIKGKGSIPLDREFMLISSRFGFRSDPFKGKKEFSQGGDEKEQIKNLKVNSPFHAGLDLSAANINGQNVYNFLDGTVKKISKGNTGYGKFIIVDNGDFETYYAHLSEINSSLKEGQFVTSGQEIGKVGSTGRSTGPHLHLEIVVNNVAVNPQVFLHNAIERDEHDAYMEDFILNIVAD